MLTHDGQRITFSTEAEGSAITVSVSNASGVTMALTGLDSDEVISGTVTVNDQQVGTNSETSSGQVILHYEDGSMESLQ